MHRLFAYWRDFLNIYKTIQKKTFCEITERHSRFIGYIRPANTENEANMFINNIRTKHWDAKHNVYAYSILKDNVMRYSDDGEPHGTAGMPVLNVLKRNEITNAVIVVTRYFGGILLGTGGLIRAYSDSAKLAVDSAGIISMLLCFRLQIYCDYNMYGKVSAIIMSMSPKVEKPEFLDKVKMNFYIDKDKLDSLNKSLNDIISGKIKIEIIGEKYIPVNLF